MPTDAQYNGYLSLMRIAQHKLRNTTQDCIPPSTLQEVSVYRRKDTFVGLVITMEESSSVYEALFTPLEHSLHLAGQDEATKRLIHIEVCSYTINQCVIIIWSCVCFSHIPSFGNNSMLVFRENIIVNILNTSYFLLKMAFPWNGFVKIKSWILFKLWISEILVPWK